MFLSVQAEGMGGAVVAYPLDAISAYHQPAIRPSLGSRLDFEAGEKILGWGLNSSFCSWLAAGASTYLGKLEGGFALSFLSQSLGISIRERGFAVGLFGEWGWRASWGIVYQRNKLNGGIAIHPYPGWTLAAEKNRVGLEWRLSTSRVAFRTGFSLKNRISLGASYYYGLTQEFSFFVSSKYKFGFAAGMKW
jgi:hypothetical protein